VKPDGSGICVRLTPEDAGKVKGALFIGGACKDLEKQVK
jgi:hypothetical protein